MIQKLKSSLITSLVLFIIAFGLVWYNDGFEEAISLTKEYWWFLVLLPAFLMLYSWFRSVKRKAFDLGAGIERDKDGNIIKKNKPVG